MFMLDLMVALGFFTDDNNVVGWEKKTHDNAVVVCLYTQKIVEGAKAESDYQWLDIVQVDGEWQPVFSYCNIAPMNSEYYYGKKITKK